MSKTFEDKPIDWAEWGDRIVDVGGDIFYSIIGDIEAGGKAANVWVWHWHTPSKCQHCLKQPEPDGEHTCTCSKRDEDCTEHPSLDRWQLSACGNHEVIQVEPLTLSPSLACHDGCPSHGWITDGVWRPA